MENSRVIAWGNEFRTVHQRLRDAIELARESIESSTVGAPVPEDLLIFCWGFCTALNGHHQGEDSTLFPLVSGAQPELEPVVRNLVRDHNMISALIGGLRRSMDSGDSQEKLLQHLDGIDAVMETHFRYEEKQILAAIERIDFGQLTTSQVLGPLAG